MDRYNFISPPACVGGHIHFSVRMRGINQHVYVSTVFIESDARRLLNQSEAANHVRQNTRRFVDAARQKIGREPTGPITLKQGDYLEVA